uniref:SCP domain-containing protein n=1 Tax=Oryza punctata TaxID=4537 RepID=A0A0E0MPZ1_ORYPU
MRRYATVIAVVLGLLAAAHNASTTPDQSYGGEPLKPATATVAPKQPTEDDIAKAVKEEEAVASAEDAAAALVTGFTAGAENSSPGVTSAMKPVLEKTDAGQFSQDVPWIPDPNDESNPSKSLPPVMPSKGGAGSPPAKEVEVDYYASTQPKKPEEPPTVASVQKDCAPPGKPEPKPATGYGTSMPVPATPSAPPKEYSSPAAPGVVPVQPSSPATATPAAAASSSKPPPNDPYAPASSNTPAASSTATEQKDGLNEKSISDIVKEHNMFRARENVPPIEWNATLAKYAQEYAEQRRGDCQLEHSHGPYGENMILIDWFLMLDDIIFNNSSKLLPSFPTHL